MRESLDDGLRLDGFGVAFGERTVLRSVSFAMPATGCTVLLGPSGTGKSTLLRTLAGYNDANPSLRTWGEMRHGGSDDGRRPALVMQKSQLLVSSVLENLVCELPNRSGLKRAEQLDLVETALERYGLLSLRSRLNEKVIGCPLGEQRLIAILRMALAQPPLLMADEPTAGLAPEAVAPVLELLRQLAREHAVLVVMHHLQQTRLLADRVVLLASGVIQETAAVDDFFSNPQSDAARAFVRTGSCPEDAAPEVDEDEALEPPCCGDAPESDAPAPPETAEAPEAGELASRGQHTVREDPRAASAAYGPRGFAWLIRGRLAGTPFPGIVHDVQYDLDALKTVGITRLISLTEQPFNPELALPFGIRCHAAPIVDMAPPSLEEGGKLCHQIDHYLHQGEVVAVHCKAGLGRTGTVLAAYWIWSGGGRIGALEALEHVRRIHPGWVQSEAQVRFLDEFAQAVSEGAFRPECAADGPDLRP